MSKTPGETFGSRRANKLRRAWIAERLIESFAFSIGLNRGHLEAGIFSAGFYFPFRGKMGSVSYRAECGEESEPFWAGGVTYYL